MSLVKLATALQDEEKKAEKRSRMLEWLITGNTNEFLKPVMNKIPGGGWRD